MRKIFYLIALSLLLIQCDNPVGFVIKGKIENCNSDYVILSHSPRLRGNLNFDNFKSISAKIDSNGNFKLESKNVIDKGNYTLTIADKSFPLVLFEGDKVQLSFDFSETVNAPFFIGKGAGKNNVLNLSQFSLGINPAKFSNLSDFKNYSDSLVNSELAILTAIYQQDTASQAIAGLKNKKNIVQIIRESPLSEIEYNFLKRFAEMNKFLISTFSTYFCSRGLNDSIGIDFNGELFENFNDNNYQLIDNLNHWKFENALESIILVEYFRIKQKQSNQLLCAECTNYWDDSLYVKFSKLFLKNNFTQDFYNHYFAHEISAEMTLGRFDENVYPEFISQTTSNKYTKRLNSFHDLLLYGLSDSTYNLNSENYELTVAKLDSLLKSQDGKPVYIIFWSAQFSGASIIPLLPGITHFENEYKNQFKVLNICIDTEDNKPLWAARIIDNKWNANHYFVSKEKNDSIISRFECDRIFSFCDGGATYSFLDLNGDLINKVKAPWLLNDYEIKELVNVTVR